MRKFFSTSILFLCISSSAFAQEECKAIAEDEARLACYDIALSVLETETEVVADNGKWIVQTDISPLTDDKNVFLRLSSENDVPGRFGGVGKGTLWIRCMENTTAVLIDFNGHYMSDHAGGGTVEFRRDDSPLYKSQMRESNDNSALGLWNGGASIPFIKGLLGRKQLIVRATPFSKSAITITSDISGIDNAISGIRETCSW